MSKSMSKHRPGGGTHSGGGGGGGQPQSQQRQQSMPDFTRQEGRQNFSHLRQNNQQAHMQSNTIPPVNMHHQSVAQNSQSQVLAQPPPAMMRNYVHQAPHQTQANASIVAPQQPIPVGAGGHIAQNASQPVNLMQQQHMMQHRNQQPPPQYAQQYIPSANARMPMPPNRPQYSGHNRTNTSVSNPIAYHHAPMQTFATPFMPYPMYITQMNANTAQLAAAQYNPNFNTMLTNEMNYSTLQRYPPATQQPINMTPTELYQQPQQQQQPPQQQPQSQPPPPPIEKKREKKFLIIQNPDGSIFNLQKDIKKASVTKDTSNSESSTETVNSLPGGKAATTTTTTEATINGIDSDKESQLADKVYTATTTTTVDQETTQQQQAAVDTTSVEKNVVDELNVEEEKKINSDIVTEKGDNIILQTEEEKQQASTSSVSAATATTTPSSTNSSCDIVHQTTTTTTVDNNTKEDNTKEGESVIQQQQSSPVVVVLHEPDSTLDSIAQQVEELKLDNNNVEQQPVVDQSISDDITTTTIANTSITTTSSSSGSEENSAQLVLETSKSSSDSGGGPLTGDMEVIESSPPPVSEVVSSVGAAAGGDVTKTSTTTEEESIPLNETTTTTTDSTLSSPEQNKEHNNDGTNETSSSEFEGEKSPQLSRNSSQNEPRVYDRGFLLSLRDCPNSPLENLKLPEILRKENSKSSPNYVNSFMPSFANGDRSLNDSFRKDKPQAVRRPSQPSKNYPDKSRKITSTSLHHDSMHHIVPDSNAWRPGKVTSDDPVEVETELLLKNVRAILNKLTPQNYGTLLEQFKNLKIDTKDRLSRVIDLIFDKAVKEPAFVVQYAGFCSELINIKVSEVNEKKEKVDVKFKILLIKKCEQTFYTKMYSDITDYEERLKEIEECTDEQKKKELEEVLDDDKRWSRRRSIGNIKLIAELFKLRMLNARVMFMCFNNLIMYKHEEYIECLCALITNIGLNLTSEIENKPEETKLFENLWNQLKSFQEQKGPFQVSSRVRFMILDLIDLRKNKWVPRRKTDGPKTIAQVHEDMEKAARQKAFDLEQKRKKNYGRSNDEEWQQVKTSRKTNISKSKVPSNLNITLILESLKDPGKNSKPGMGSGSPFDKFAMGSHGGTNSNSQSRSSSSNFENKYQLLSSDNKNTRSSTSFHDSLHAKDGGRRDERKISDVTNYYQSNRDSLPNSRNSSMRDRDSSANESEAKSHIDIDERTFQKKTKELVAWYVDSPDPKKAIKELLQFCSSRMFNKFICESLCCVLEKSSPKRQTWGEFMGQLFITNYYENSEIFEGLKALFLRADDFLIDLPNFWQFVGIILAYSASEIYSAHQDKNLKAKEVFKVIDRALGEVTGNAVIRLTKGLVDTLNNIEKDESIEIQDLLGIRDCQTNANPNSIVEFVEKYLKNECKLSSLESQLKGGDNSPITKSALYSHVLNLCTDNTFLSNRRLVEIFKHYVQSHEDQLQLLGATCDLYSRLNRPNELLLILFDYFVRNEIVGKAAFKDWFEAAVNAHNVAKACCARFIQNILSPTS